MYIVGRQPTGSVAALASSTLRKVLYREAEKVAKEQPAGTLATKDMPKRKKGSSLDKAQFEEAFSKWMRTSIHAKVRATDSCTKPRPVVCAVLCVRCARCVV